MAKTKDVPAEKKGKTVTATATIKEAKITQNGCRLNISGMEFEFSAGQYEQLAEIVESKEQVVIAIQFKQRRLFDSDCEEDKRERIDGNDKGTCAITA